MLVVKQDLCVYEFLVPVKIVTELKIFLPVTMSPKEIGNHKQIDVAGKELSQPAAETPAGLFIYSGVIIQTVNVAGAVGEGCDVFVSKGPLCLFGYGRTVEPHRLGNKSSVVRQYTILNINEVLRVKRGQYHKDIFQRYPAYDKCRSGIKGRQRNTLTGLFCIAVSVNKGVHRLDRLGLPVRDDITVVFIQSEVFADIHIKIVLVALVAEQCVAPGYIFGRNKPFKTLQLFVLTGKPPGLKVKIKLVFIHYELPQPHQLLIAAFAL